MKKEDLSRIFYLSGKDMHMDHKRPSIWDEKYGSQNSPGNHQYQNQPTHSEYKGHGFAIACAIFGMLSMLLTCTGVLPFIMAAFSFLFAALAYRKGRRFHHFATYGVIASCLGTISAIIMLLQIFTYPLEDTQSPYYQQILQQYRELLP